MALIRCSYEAARRDVVEKMWSRVLGEIIRENVPKVMGVRQSYLTSDVVEADKMLSLGDEEGRGLVAVAEDMVREEEGV